MTPLTELIENEVQRIKVNQEWRRITKRVKLSPDDFRRKAEALTNSGKPEKAAGRVGPAPNSRFYSFRRSCQ